jgi:undecaprenyl-diphosphatase
MILKIIEESVEFLLIITCMYLMLGAYMYRYQPAWSASISKRRLVILMVFVVSVIAIKLSEDVLGGETGPIDNAILLFIHSLVIHGYAPTNLNGLFEAITLSGSSKVLFPLVSVTIVALLYTRHRLEALLVATSVISATIVIYVVKTLTGRARPELWDTEWYWGSSFPSGHTLAVAAFASATVLCVGRIRPASRNFALLIAILWIALVAFSRLALGVHWPTDVLVAICIGVFIPLALSVVLELCDV